MSSDTRDPPDMGPKRTFLEHVVLATSHLAESQTDYFRCTNERPRALRCVSTSLGEIDGSWRDR
jgi:hypothetical protein